MTNQSRYEVTSDEAVREFQERLNNALELAKVCTHRASVSEYMRGKLLELRDALVAVNDQWNEAVQWWEGEEGEL